MATGDNKKSSEGDDSDVELEGVDLEDDEPTGEDEVVESEKLGSNDMDDDVDEDLEHDDHDELEAARKERLELMAAEAKKVLPEAPRMGKASVQEQLDYLLSQSEVFAHFLAGSVAAQTKGKKKGGSRGKTGRLTEAEEDEQMLKSAQSKRRVIRLDTQPSILAPHCKMHSYQLEGLNWLIKLHCNGINGILAD